MTQVIQQLTVFLEGGQNIVIPFNAEKPEILNPQIDKKQLPEDTQ